MLSALKALKESGGWKKLLFHTSWSLTLTSGLSYFLGFVRDRVFVQTFGLSRTLDIFNASFVIPEMILGVLVGTALSAAFVPIFTQQYDKNKELGYKYAHQVITWGVMLMAIASVIAGVLLPFLTQWTVPGFSEEETKLYILLTRIMLLSPVLFTISNSYGRVLISVREFLWFGLSPALYNLGIIFGAVFLAPRFGTVGLVIGTLIGVILHLIARFIPLKRKKYGFTNRIDFNFSPEIKETIFLSIPKLLQYTMWFVMVMAFTSIASNLPEGSVAAYNYARNFQSLPVSLLGIAIAMAMYPDLSHDAGKGNFRKFRNDFKRNVIRMIFYTVLAAIALAAISRPMITVLFGGGKFGGSDIILLSNVLIVYCFSIPLESLLHAYHRGYYSVKNTIIPSLSHTAIIIITIVLAKILVKHIGVYAIPVSFSAGLLIHITILAMIFPFMLKRKEMKFLNNF